eukprot:GHVP01024079.1.p1 GENE.GHVP01024079.1~~GHVP01024079.1.p1  ORF type:complete len:163 (-),score=11.75 GHVP01024079.1:45-533(-)
MFEEKKKGMMARNQSCRFKKHEDSKGISWYQTSDHLQDMAYRQDLRPGQMVVVYPGELNQQMTLDVLNHGDTGSREDISDSNAQFEKYRNIFMVEGREYEILTFKSKVTMSRFVFGNDRKHPHIFYKLDTRKYKFQQLPLAQTIQEAHKPMSLRRPLYYSGR